MIQETTEQDGNEIPDVFVFEIAGWRRIVHGANDANKHSLFDKAATELWRFERERRTLYSAAVAISVQQHIVDELADMAGVAGIHPDDATAKIGAARVAIESGEGNAVSSVDAMSPPKPNGGARPRYDWRDHAVTASALQHQTFAPIAYVVPGLIAEGLSILAGAPKLGKSWMALDMSLGVAGGRPVLGGIIPLAGDVLYVALEDTPRRLQTRTDRLLSPFSTVWPTRLTLATHWRRLDAGGLNDIRSWADGVAEPRLVVLDTLAAVRPQRAEREQLYDTDYHALLGLHQLAGERRIALVVVHHRRKADADDPLDTVSGTLGLAGCADTVLVLARGGQGTTLYVRGRDIEESERAIAWDRGTCRWTLLGDAAEVHRSEGRTAILAALDAGATAGPISPQEIAAATGIDRANVDRLLGRMVAAGEVIRISRGRYVRETRETRNEQIHPQDQ